MERDVDPSVKGQCEPQARAPEHGRVRGVFQIFGVLLFATAIQIVVIRSGHIHWNSDQAIVATMARDILERGVHPVFYYGSSYAGSLEPHWVAFVFVLLGPSIQAYRVAMMFLLSLLIAIVYGTARLGFGKGVGLLSAAYLALPPWFFFYKGLTSDGAYAATAVLGAACLYVSIRLEAALRGGGPPGLWLAGLGLVAGMGWWVDPLIVYFYLAIFVWFALVRPVIFARPSSYAIFLPAFVVGGFPWWVSNLRWGWKSLLAPELAPVNFAQTLSHLRSFWAQGLPILLGPRPVYDRTDSFPGEAMLSAALFLVPIGVSAAAIWRQRRRIRDREGGCESDEARALLLLLLVLVCGMAVVSLNNRADLSEPRFLFPLYAVFPIVLAFSILELLKAGPARRWIAALVLVLALASSVRGFVRSRDYHAYPDQTGNGSLADVIQELEHRGIHSVYTSYWVAYRLSFESDERVVATPFGEWGFTRIPRYREAADRDPQPAFVLYGEDAENLERYLSSRGARYQGAALGPFRLFFDLDADSLRELRANGTVPAVPSRLVPAA